MIFVTVGGSTPFERLVSTVDAWARQCGRSDVFAQIGEAGHPPESLHWERFLTPSVFRERVRTADLVVSHAGMGTVMTAMELGAPLVVVPRRVGLGETRSDHQLEIAPWLADHLGLVVARDEVELRRWLDFPERLSPPSPVETGGAQLRDYLRGVLKRV